MLTPLHLQARYLVLQQDREGAGIGVMADPEGAGGGRIGAGQEVIDRVVVEPEKTAVALAKMPRQLLAPGPQALTAQLQQLQGESVAGQGVALENFTEHGWVRRPGCGFQGRVIEDFLAIPQVLGQFPVIVAEGIVDGARDRLPGGQRLLEKSPAACLQCGDELCVNAVIAHLKKPPVGTCAGQLLDTNPRRAVQVDHWHRRIHF